MPDSEFTARLVVWSNGDKAASGASASAWATCGGNVPTTPWRLTVAETAVVLGVAPVTIKWDSALARTTLDRELRGRSA